MRLFTQVILASIATLPTVNQTKILASDEVAITNNAVTQFIEEHEVLEAKTEVLKIQRILNGLFDAENPFTYESMASLTPEEALMFKRGNCVTFSMLFVAIAREAGLEASLNEVDIAPEWNQIGDVVVESSHVNAVVDGKHELYVVEWIDALSRINSQQVNPISDERGLSYHHSNLAILAIAANDLHGARIEIQEAVRLDPQNSTALQNLGVIELLENNLSAAEKALLKAAKHEKKRSSIDNMLSDFYEQKGLPEKAESFRKSAKKKSERNPFYHHRLAKSFKEDHELNKAIKHLKKAIRLFPDYEPFQVDLANAYQAKDPGSEYDKHAERAQRYAKRFITAAR